MEPLATLPPHLLRFCSGAVRGQLKVWVTLLSPDPLTGHIMPVPGVRTNHAGEEFSFKQRIIAGDHSVLPLIRSKGKT